MSGNCHAIFGAWRVIFVCGLEDLAQCMLVCVLDTRSLDEEFVCTRCRQSVVLNGGLLAEGIC